MISSLEQLVEQVKRNTHKHRIAVVWAQDSNTLGAVARSVEAGFVEAQLIGDIKEITSVSTISLSTM